LGIDKIIENIVERLGDVEQVFVTGALARGIDSNIIDLIIIGEIDIEYLIKLIAKAEVLIERKIRYVIYSAIDIENNKKLVNESLLIWKKDI
jgi:hypothetical protein